MRRFGRNLLSALLPELLTGVKGVGKTLLEGPAIKTVENMLRAGGLNTPGLGRSILGGMGRVGKRLLESHVPVDLPTSSNQEGKTLLAVYDPFRGLKISVSKLVDIISDPSTTPEEKKWAIRKHKNIKKKFKTQV